MIVFVVTSEERKGKRGKGTARRPPTEVKTSFLLPLAELTVSVLRVRK